MAEDRSSEVNQTVYDYVEGTPPREQARADAMLYRAPRALHLG